MNSGGWRPINVHIPEGTTLNPTWPAPVGGFADIMFGPVQGCMLSVLGQLIPDQLSAALRSGANQVNASGKDPSRGNALWHLFEFASGGWPACKDNDGNLNTYQWDMGDLPTIWPFERMEQIRPLKAQYNDMYVDSGGPGYRRGGLGIKRMWEVTAPTGVISILTSDAILPRPGMSMGYGGALNSITAQRDGREIPMSDIPGKVGGFPLQQGDCIITLSSGGGGYGDPLTRPVEWVQNDIESGYISLEGARADYGVVITTGAVDPKATEVLREELRAQRVRVRINATEEDTYDAKGRRLLCVSSEIAEHLQVKDGSIVEYVPESGVPLRAWIKIDPDLIGEASPLGPIGRAILRLSEGETMWIRTPWTSVNV
jgi:N-methylhydantoinase B